MNRPIGATRTVIIGAGQAGRRCAEALRDLDAGMEIILLGEEPHAPYDRPPLSKAVLLGTDPGNGLFVRAPEFYAERRIDLRLNTRVAAIDPAGRTVTTAAGERIAWDHLVIATGARARRLRIPGAEDPRVLTLRRLEDSQALKARLAEQPRLAVVGGGLIGLEVAASARQLGCAVSVLEAADRLMARCVPPAISDRYADLHRGQGVALHLGCALTAIEAAPDGALLLHAGAARIAADLVVVGIGGVAETALAEAAGIAVRDGILTDAQGRTGLPGIFAAGEVARFPHPFWGGRPMRLEAWQVAQNQPAAVARAICGQDAPYDEIPWHWTDQFGWNLQVLGDPDPTFTLVERADGERLTAIALDAAGRARGAVLINNGRDATPCRRLIGGGKVLDAAALADAATPLRAFL
ncbi:MAG: FAD-dependent oxidoreductase [Acetobacteraceae bacterium]|nr:FAD-dependent oxidoreductase [Acetobacteraceae bacterium]